MIGYGTQSSSPQLGRNALANVGRGVRQTPTNFAGRPVRPNWAPAPASTQNNARPGQVADRMFSGAPLGSVVPPRVPAEAPMNPYQQPTNGVAGSPTGPSKVPFPWPSQRPAGGGQAMPGTQGMGGMQWAGGGGPRVPYDPYQRGGLQMGQAQASLGPSVSQQLPSTGQVIGAVKQGGEAIIDAATGGGGSGGGGSSPWSGYIGKFAGGGGVPGVSGIVGDNPSWGDIYNDLLGAVNSGNDPYGKMAEDMSKADVDLWKRSMGKYADAYDSSMGLLGEEGRAAAREADRQKMLAGIQEQTDRALQYAQGTAGRGGAVGSSVLPGIYGGAQKAAAMGEMQAAQDAWGRTLTGEQARTGLAGDMMSRLQDSLTTRKELLAATLEAAAPGGFLQYLMGIA